MKMRYKHIHFVEAGKEAGKVSYNCLNNKTSTILGQVFFYNAWRQYALEPEDRYIVFSQSCLADIIDFMKQLKG